MEFHESNAIYLQIASNIMDRIVQDEWLIEKRIPSVRVMATELSVNPNTIMRAYMFLESKNIIQNQRGIGYFVSPNASSAIIALRKQEFLEQDLPKFFRSLDLLNIDIREIENLYHAHQNSTNTGNKDQYEEK